MESLKAKLARDSLVINGIWRDSLGRLGIDQPVGDTLNDAAMLSTEVSRASGGMVKDTTEMALNLHWRARWGSFGYPVFALTHSLEAALIMTDCSDVAGCDFVWPFDSFLVELPFPGALSYIDADGSTQVQAKWIVAHRFTADLDNEMPKALDKVSDLARSMGYVGPSTPIDKLRVYLAEASRIMGEHSERAKWYKRSYLWLCGEENHVSVHTNGRLPEGDRPLSDWLDPVGKGDDVGYALTDKDKRSLDVLRRVVANLCLYIAGLPPAALSRRQASVSPDPTVETKVPSVKLGTEVKLPREMRDAAKAFVEEDRSAAQRAAWKLRSKHSVRGHWRQQAVGPRGEGQHRRMWIQPFWKGPQDASVIGRTYNTSLAGEPAKAKVAK